LPTRLSEVGKLYDLMTEVDKVIDQRGLDAFKVKGQMSLKAGFFVSLVTPSMPDDDVKMKALLDAAREVLGVTLRA